MTLHDRCDKLGGLGKILEYEGFRHDAGRRVPCALWLFEEVFALFGRKAADGVTLAPLDQAAEASGRPLGWRHLAAARAFACELPEWPGQYLGRLAQARMVRL